MLVATFGPSTAWVGKTITFENGQFVLEGHGPISAPEVMDYDRQGHLVWVNDGTRAWAGAKAGSPSAPRPETSDAVTGAKTAAAWTNHAAPAAAAPRHSLPSRLHIVTGALAAVAVILVAVLAFSSRPDDSKSTAAKAASPSTSASPAVIATYATPPAAVQGTWPSTFEGVWLSTSSDNAEVGFSQSADTAIIRIAPGSGTWTDLTFRGDTMTMTTSGDERSMVYKCASAPADQFVGSYRSTLSPDLATSDFSYDMAFNGSALTMTIGQQGSGSELITFTLQGDGRTMLVATSGNDSPGTETFLRQ